MPEHAVQQLRTAVERSPGNKSAQYLLSSAYTGTKQYDRALPILLRLADLFPQEALFPYSAGAVQYLAGNYLAAEKELRKSLALDPDGIGSLYYLGLTLRKQQRMDEAESVFHKLLTQSSQHPAGLTALGETLLAERRFDDAKSVLEQAVAADPASVNAHYVLGRTLARLGMKEASQEQFAIVNSLNRPGMSWGRSLLGVG